jgi:hypothetical protein
MTERHKQLVLAIETISDEFVSDRHADEKSFWGDWFQNHKKMALTIFDEYRELQNQYFNHPDYNRVIYDSDFQDDDGLMELSDCMSDILKQFYKIALPVMIRDTGASKIQESITKIDGPIADDGSHYIETNWNLLQENQDLNNEAWAHIGKELTFRLFNRVHKEKTRGRGRPKKLLSDKHVHVARQVLALKRALYEPYYDLAPFSDVEVVTALLSNHKSDKLKAVLVTMGLTPLISVERVCNLISAGRKELSGYWLREDSISISNDEDYFRDDSITIEQRIEFAEEYLGPLTEVDKDTIRQGFSCPTEVRQALTRPNLSKVNLEEIVTWKLKPEQIREVIAVAKSKFGLKAFKSVSAQKKTRGYW